MFLSLDRIEYNLGDGVLVSVRTGTSLVATLLITSSQPLMLFLTVVVYDLPNRNCLIVPRCRRSRYCLAFHYAVPTVCNSLPDELRYSVSLDSF